MEEDIKKIDEQIQSMTEKPEEIADTASAESSDTKMVDTISDLKEEPVEEKTEEVVEELTEEPVEENPPVEEVKEVVPTPPVKKKSPVIIGLLIAGIILLGIILAVVLVLRSTPKKEEKIKKKELTAAEKKQIIQEYGEALQGIITVYFNQKEILLNYEDAILLVHYDHEVVCDEHEIYEDGSLYLNQCSIDEEEVAYSFGTKQEKQELKEGAIKVYVSKDNGKATLKEPTNVKDYEVYSFDIEGKYSSLYLLGEKSDYVVYKGENFAQYMYNYKKRVKALEDVNYTYIQPIAYDNKEFDQNYVAVRINDKWGVYQLNTGKSVVPNTHYFFNRTGYYGESGTLDVAMAVSDGLLLVYNGNEYGLINYHTNEMVIPFQYSSLIKSGDYLIAYDSSDKKTHLLKFDGSEILANHYDKIHYMVDGKYILVEDQNHVKMVNPSGKELYDYGEVKLGSFSFAMAYKNGAVFQYTNPGYTDEQVNKGCLEVIYDPDTNSGQIKEEYCGGVAKPILYLYPKKTTKVTVSFEHPEFLETTYPKFDGKWEVTAKKNGNLTDKNGKNYYALYWDEVRVHTVDFHTGFYVTKDNSIDFLEEKLTTIGLNERERNEFIMYWLPILEKNGQSLVYFELTEERESYHPIHITPQPDSLLRLVIHIQKVDHKVDIPEEPLSKFQRKGFVAVEWGGTTY